MEARVRRATVDDAATIAAIHVETWRAAYAHAFPAEYLEALSVHDRLDLWTRTLAGGTFDVFVAVLGDRIAGFVSSGPAEDLAAPGELFALYVLPSAWGHGLGRALLERAETALREGGHDAAVLWVLEDNPGPGASTRRRDGRPTVAESALTPAARRQRSSATGSG